MQNNIMSPMGIANLTHPGYTIWTGTGIIAIITWGTQPIRENPRYITWMANNKGIIAKKPI